MKYVKLIVLLIVGFIINNSICYAERFSEGQFIPNAYIKKIDNNNKVYYLTSRFILDQNGNYVYCIEPFKSLSTSIEYNSYNYDYERLSGLDDYTWSKIAVAAYFGYGYENHNDPIWYSITQVLIWNYMYPQNQIFFTETLNGKQTHIYDSKLEELNNMVLNYLSIDSSFSRELTINYGDTEIIPLKEGFELISTGDYYYINNNNLYITPNFSGDDTIRMEKRNYYNSYIYLANDSQKLLRVNDLIEVNPYVRIHSLAGKLNLNFLLNNFNSVCDDNKRNILGFYDADHNLIRTIDLDESSEYVFNNLKYGKYYLYQLEHNCHLKDYNANYEIIVNQEELYHIIDFKEEEKNVYLTHNICIENNCIPESNIIFEFDSDYGKMSVITDNEGKASFNIVKGDYIINQKNGDINYSYYQNILLNTDDYKNDIYLSFDSYLKYSDLKIIVEDEDNNLIDGVTLCVSNNNKSNDCYNTINGQIYLDKIPLGIYYIKENDVPEKYILDDTIQRIDLNENNILRITNKIKPVDNLVNETIMVEEHIEPDNYFADDYIIEETNISDINIDNPYTKTDKKYLYLNMILPVYLLINCIWILIRLKTDEMTNN